MIEYNSCKKAINACIEQKYFAIAHLYFEEQTMNMHIHDCYEIYYSISGGKQFLIDNKSYPIQPGDLFFINQYESHYLTQINNSEHDRIIISVHPEYLKELSTTNTELDDCFHNRKPGFSHRISLDKDQQQRFNYYIHKLTNLSAYAKDVMERSIFTELMVMLNKTFNAQCQSVEKDSCLSYPQDQKIDVILEFINQNINQIITIEQLAGKFYISKSYLCRIFKASTGTTVYKYLIARRISIAKGMLSEGINVNEVCNRCGYRDYSNFLKAFTKIVGISPKKYALYSTK